MTQRDKKFWIVQLLGWTIFIIINTGIQIWVNGAGLTNIATSLLFGTSLFVISAFFRGFIRKRGWHEYSPQRLIIPILSGVIIMSLLADISLIFIITFSNYFAPPKVDITFSLLFVNFINVSLVFSIWSAIYFAYQYFKKYNKVQVEKLQLQLKVKEAELGILKSQINPHFMFNSLNNIRALILENQEQARLMLTHLSDILRYSLAYTKSEKVSLESELEIVRYYFELASIQYESRLKYSIEVDEDLKQVKIPPMLIQLLVENSIKHGIAILPEGGEVNVKVEQVDGIFKIQVSNTGQLGQTNKTAEKLGIGLKNIKERLRLLYDKGAKFYIFQRDNEVFAEVIINDISR